MGKTMDTICYLCGKPGADSKDHVPPKCFLPQAEYNKYQRITIPAHRTCNSGASEDEEYLRDLLVQEAAELKMPKAELLTDKVWRSWAKGGWKRYQKIIRTAKPVEKRSPEGLYAGKAIGVVPELPRVEAVCKKIALGIVYYDAGAVLIDSPPEVVPLKLYDAIQERERSATQSFWIGMNSSVCLHDMCADTIALRRFYEGFCTGFSAGGQPQIQICAHVAIIMWNLFCVCTATFPLERVSHKDFKFAVNTSNGTWRRASDAGG